MSGGERNRSWGIFAIMIQNFASDKIKRDMMELWKSTFHDSSRYIKLVFDTYFKPENAFTVYDGEKLIAALLGVEYDFQSPQDNGQMGKFRGLYLCGLATRPDYRKRGIMGELMNRVEISAKERDFLMTFLIPADSHLREYYQKKGYVNASYRRCEMMKNEKSDAPASLHIYTFAELFERGNMEFICDLAQWCCDREKQDNRCVSILHSKKDMVAIMAENENSFFITESTFDPEYPILAKVMCVVFPTNPDEEKKLWGIVGIYIKENNEDILSELSQVRLPEKIRDTIQKIHPDYDVELNLPYTGRELMKQGKAESYAMVKCIAENENYKNIENQIFKISLMLD